MVSLFIIFLVFSLLMCVTTVIKYNVNNRSRSKIKNNIRKAIDQAPPSNRTILLSGDDVIYANRIITRANGQQVFEYIKPVEQKPLSMKEAIEKALPNTPVGCMWSVKKIKEEWWHGIVSVPVAYKTKLQFVSSEQASSEVGFKSQYMTINSDSELWPEVPESGKKYKMMLEIQLIAPDKTITAKLDVDESLSNNRMIEKLTSAIGIRCARMVEDYRRNEEVWDGVYIKNGE